MKLWGLVLPGHGALGEGVKPNKPNKSVQFLTTHQSALTTSCVYTFGQINETPQFAYNWCKVKWCFNSSTCTRQSHQLSQFVKLKAPLLL
jgi:hypothetical protein